MLVSHPVWADEITLRSGGVVRAEVVRDASTPRDQVALESTWGKIVLNRRQVAGLTEQTPAHAEYRRRAPTVSDTVESQHALAMWCRNNGLADEMRAHLERVVALDPNHEEARLLLGYQRVGDRWLTRDDRLANRGLVRQKGDFRTRQEIELIARIEQAEAAQRLWKQKIERWRKDLDSNKSQESQAAQQALAGITDPVASASVAAAIAREEHPAVKKLLLRTAGQLRTGPTRQVLVNTALQDPDGETRAIAIEQLALEGLPSMAQPFVAALQSKDNATINRAAVAIAELATQAAIEPLISSLVTTHRHKIGSESGGQSYSFNANSGQFGFGGGGPQVVTQERQNPKVLQALVDLSGVNFGYDQQRWRDWLASQQVAVDFDLRRDP